VKRLKKGDGPIFRAMRAINGSVAFSALLALPVAADALDLKVRVEAEGRWFYEAENADDDGPVLGSLAGTAEIYQSWDDGRSVTGELFYRYDENDPSRTHGDVRELYYQQSGDRFEFRVGARRVFWGVTESRHLVDIVNQSDFVENISNELKLGQPMMSLAWIGDLGTTEFFLMPYQRARTFPGPKGYTRFPLEIHAHEAIYESRHEQEHVDYAVRHSGSFGPVDLGVSWFDGTAREPRLAPCVRRNASGTYIATPDGPACDAPNYGSAVLPPPLVPPPNYAQLVAAEIQANVVLVPFYDLWRQASVDAQYVAGSMAWKLEGAWRETGGVTTWGSVAGFEYTFGDVRGSGVDVGVLGEFLWDEKRETLNVFFDDELFVGVRLALNDVAGTTLLAGVIADRVDATRRRYGLEASRRLDDDWKLSGELRVFSKWPTDDNMTFLADQDFLTMTLERYF
jgi:hypothetical protein